MTVLSRLYVEFHVLLYFVLTKYFFADWLHFVDRGKFLHRACGKVPELYGPEHSAQDPQDPQREAIDKQY